MMERRCWGGDCKCISGTPACCKVLLNRFFFARRNESAATRVTSMEELHAFVKGMGSLPSAWWRNTLVLAQDLEISGLVQLDDPIRVCGEATPDGRRTRLAIVDNSILVSMGFLDGLHLSCGDDDSYYNGQYRAFPAVQTIHSRCTVRR
jgi:hypothetical protein